MLFYSGRQGHIVDLLLLQQRTAPLLPSVALSDIALAVLAAAAVALAAYHLARRIVAVVRKRDLTACGISKPGKLVGYATGGVAAVILLIALLGRARGKTRNGNGTPCALVGASVHPDLGWRASMMLFMPPRTLNSPRTTARTG